MSWLLSRLKEGSTWAGIAAFFQALKVFAPHAGVYADAVSAGAASIAVALPDAGAAATK